MCNSWAISLFQFGFRNQLDDLFLAESGRREDPHQIAGRD
jgi:hypothetical protein